MKRLTVVVTDVLFVPNSFRVTVHPTDEIECLEIRGRHYLPGIHWLERHRDPENPPHGIWLEDAEATEAIASRTETEEVDFTLEDVP